MFQLSAFMLFFLSSYYAWGVYTHHIIKIADHQKKSIQYDIKALFGHYVGEKFLGEITNNLQKAFDVSDTFFVLKGYFFKTYDNWKNNKKNTFKEDVEKFIRIFDKNFDNHYHHMRCINMACLELVEKDIQKNETVKTFLTQLIPLFDSFGTKKNEIFEFLKQNSKNIDLQQVILGLEFILFDPLYIHFFYNDKDNSNRHEILNIVDMHIILTKKNAQYSIQELFGNYLNEIYLKEVEEKLENYVKHKSDFTLELRFIKGYDSWIKCKLFGEWDLTTIARNVTRFLSIFFKKYGLSCFDKGRLINQATIEIVQRLYEADENAKEFFSKLFSLLGSFDKNKKEIFALIKNYGNMDHGYEKIVSCIVSCVDKMLLRPISINIFYCQPLSKKATSKLQIINIVDVRELFKDCHYYKCFHQSIDIGSEKSVFYLFDSNKMIKNSDNESDEKQYDEEAIKNFKDTFLKLKEMGGPQLLDVTQLKSDLRSKSDIRADALSTIDKKSKHFFTDSIFFKKFLKELKNLQKPNTTITVSIDNPIMAAFTVISDEGKKLCNELLKGTGCVVEFDETESEPKLHNGYESHKNFLLEIENKYDQGLKYCVKELFDGCIRAEFLGSLRDNLDNCLNSKNVNAFVLKAEMVRDFDKWNTGRKNNFEENIEKFIEIFSDRFPVFHYDQVKFVNLASIEYVIKNKKYQQPEVQTFFTDFFPLFDNFDLNREQIFKLIKDFSCNETMQSCENMPILQEIIHILDQHLLQPIFVFCFFDISNSRISDIIDLTQSFANYYYCSGDSIDKDRYYDRRIDMRQSAVYLMNYKEISKKNKLSVGAMNEYENIDESDIKHFKEEFAKLTKAGGPQLIDITEFMESVEAKKLSADDMNVFNQILNNLKNLKKSNKTLSIKGTQIAQSIKDLCKSLLKDTGCTIKFVETEPETPRKEETEHRKRKSFLKNRYMLIIPVCITIWLLLKYKNFIFCLRKKNLLLF